MTDRQELEKLLKRAVEAPPMTRAEIREQAISFVYGQLMDAQPDITKAEIAKVYDEMRGRDD